MMPRMAGNTGIKVTGHARGSAGGTDYSAWLLQADDGVPCVAVNSGGANLVIRAALYGEILDDQGLVAAVRRAIALYTWPDAIVTSEQDEDGAWCAQAILAPGIGTFGEGDTKEAAVEDCNVGLALLLDELRAPQPDPALAPRGQPVNCWRTIAGVQPSRRNGCSRSSGTSSRWSPASAK